MRIKAILTGAMLGAAMAAPASTFTVGSYNIRVITPDDKGVHNWDNRKEYVARTVIDNAMDVVGFNEVRQGRQAEELIGMLPEYTFAGWDGEENSVSTSSRDLVAFRTDKFDLLDSGYYFLNRNLTSWDAIPWDNSSITNVRHTSWAKLQVKGTDEVFFIFCTHLDHQGNIARMLQAHLNIAMMRRIAGDMPKIMVGDQNSTSSRVNFLNIYNSNFDDALIVTGANATYGDDPATSGQWNADPSSGRRIDYIWSDGFDVAEYAHCTSMYDLGAMPSDHIAIKASLTYNPHSAESRDVYVKAGSEGDGTIDSPFGTIQEALEKACRGARIHVAEGDFTVTKAIPLAKSVSLIGGYNEDFSAIVGLTRVSASGNARVFNQSGDTDVEIRHFGIYNGNMPGTSSDGGGFLAHGKRLIVRYCEFADNHAGRDGGAIDATGQLILDHVRFLRNSAVRNGGAFCADNPNKRYWYNMPVAYCHFEENSAADGSAGYLPRFIYGYAAYNTFLRNTATEGSTLYLHAVGTSSALGSKLAVFNNTFALNSAAGAEGASAFIGEVEDDGNVCVIGNTILSNSGETAAVRILAGKPFMAGNIVAQNTGGDIYYAASSVSASHNLYTCATSISNTPNSNDLYSQDFATSAATLATVLDASIDENGLLIPNLTVPEEDEDEVVTVAAQDEESDLLTPPTLFSYHPAAEAVAGLGFNPPTVKVINPNYGTGTLCKLPLTRLREATVHGDFNFDCTEDAYLPDDQNGRTRPTGNNATFGAREYVEENSILLPSANASEGTEDEAFFNLQGMRVNPASPGLYLRRANGKTEKVIIR